MEIFLPAVFTCWATRAELRLVRCGRECTSRLTMAVGAGQGRAMDVAPFDALVTRMLSRSPFDYRVAADDAERGVAYATGGSSELQAWTRKANKHGRTSLRPSRR